VKNHMMDHNREEVFSKYLYKEPLAEVFRNTLQFASVPPFLANSAWIFVTDESGIVIASEKIGTPGFAVRQSYLLSEHMGHFYAQEEIETGVRTICVPVLENAWFPGYIGLAFPLHVKEQTVLLFLQGLSNVFRLMQERYVNNIVASCVKAVNQNFGLDNVMRTIVQRMAQNLRKVECVAVVFDEEHEELLPCWSSSEQQIVSWKENAFRNSKALYEHMLSSFSPDCTVLSNGNIVMDEWLDVAAPFFEQYLISPFRYNDKMIGFLAVFRESAYPFTQQEQQFISKFTAELGLAIHNSTMYMRVQRDEERRSMLFEITKKLHSSIHVDDVLLSVVESAKKLYPEMQVDLWLSNDSFSTALPVKTFSFTTEDNQVSAQAFMESRTVIVQSDGERSLTLAAPLRGKQGVYGVLELHSPRAVSMPKSEIEYITMLADTAANAFENAQLYEQSRHLIKELLLIDEMTRQLNKNIKLTDLLDFITRKLTETFRTEHCCIFSRTEEGNGFVIRASTAKEKDAKPFLLEVPEHGKLHDLFVKKESILVVDEEETYSFLPSFACKSLMAVPLIDKDEVEGAIVLLDSEANRYTFDDFKRLEMLARHVKVAVTNASLHAEVERMVITDNLTHLYNRKYLYDSIRHSLQHDVCGSFILIDVDYFKNINDTYGHQTGDEILVQVADVLRASIRTSDIAARWGGEEMAVYLPKVNKEVAYQIAERLRMNVMAHTKPQITISSGIATWTRECEQVSVETLFQRADEALYCAKRGGRNQVCLAETTKDS
jgi:diguanylate cyclase (GGDEF)-like protein